MKDMPKAVGCTTKNELYSTTMELRNSLTVMVMVIWIVQFVVKKVSNVCDTC